MVGKMNCLNLVSLPILLLGWSVFMTNPFSEDPEIISKLNTLKIFLIGIKL